MTRPLPKFTPEPRIWNEYQVRARLGMGADRWRGMRPKLEAKGFPRRDAELKGWDANAIERWLDRRAGLRRDFPAPIEGEIAGWGTTG